MTISVYIATSLDGYIATERGDIAWLEDFPNPTNSDYGYFEFISGIDAIVMGRKTYETVVNMRPWPYDKKVFVLSRSLFEVPPELVDKVEFMSGDIKTIAKKLAERGYKNLYIDGGQTVQGFLKKNLIDELIISTLPIILGKGIPLFSSPHERIDFQHCSTEVFEGGLVKSHYKRI